MSIWSEGPLQAQPTIRGYHPLSVSFVHQAQIRRELSEKAAFRALRNSTVTKTTSRVQRRVLAKQPSQGRPTVSDSDPLSRKELMSQCRSQSVNPAHGIIRDVVPVERKKGFQTR